MTGTQFQGLIVALILITLALCAAAIAIKVMPHLADEIEFVSDEERKKRNNRLLGIALPVIAGIVAGHLIIFYALGLK